MPSFIETSGLVALAAPASYLLFTSDIASALKSQLLFSATVSICAFATTVVAVPALAEYFSRKGLKGRDLGRRGTPQEKDEIPSALGLLCGIIYLVFVIGTQLYYAKGDALADYNAALLSITFMILLGFADDVLDLPWRYKLLLPTVASLPLLANYHAHQGLTTIIVPYPLRSLLAAGDGSGLTWIGSLLDAVVPGLVIDPSWSGRIVDLGILYLVYMGMLAVFATNAINIYAGVNGLEAGQALVISVAILTANIYELASGAESGSEHAYHHIFSANLALPFIAVCSGLLWHNVYPARVFVGDTFCYFAGMLFACQGILGHFSKTLLLFLIPQVLNFLYSMPQLFKIYPCPRHRLPHFDAETNTMRPSTFVVESKAPAATATPAVDGSSATQISGPAGSLRKRTSGGATKQAEATPPAPPAAAAAPIAGVIRDNMTLINLVLRVCGPMHERTLTNTLLAIQAVTCFAGLAARYYLAVLFDPRAAASTSGK